MTELTPDAVEGRIVFLSIKPEHAEAILDGSKRYEYRRQPPVADPPFTMLLYATDGVGDVVGAALVDDVIRDNAHAVAKATVDATPQTTDDVLEYFDGKREATALKIRHAVRVEPPVEDVEIRKAWPDFTVPQNFRYVTEDDHPRLVARIRTRLQTHGEH